MNVDQMDRLGPNVQTPPGTSWVREDQAEELEEERDELKAQLNAMNTVNANLAQQRNVLMAQLDAANRDKAQIARERDDCMSWVLDLETQLNGFCRELGETNVVSAMMRLQAIKRDLDAAQKAGRECLEYIGSPLEDIPRWRKAFGMEG